ncbi:MAG: MYXO-CTERM sorting domain-containing protein, partial [Myxococcales bacterium]
TRTGSGIELDIGHEGAVGCALAQRACRVTATARGLAGVTRTSSDTRVSVEEVPELPPMTTTIQTPAGFAEGATLAPGASVSLEATATFGCSAALEHRWSCDAPVLLQGATGATVGIGHPGPHATLCRGPLPVTCRLETSAEVNGARQTADATLSFELARVDDDGAQASVALEGGLRQLSSGEQATFSLTNSACAQLLPHAWTARWVGSGEVVARQQGSSLSLTVPPICDGDTLRVEAAWAGSGRTLALEVLVVRHAGPPLVGAPEPTDFAPGPVVTLACGANTVAELRPRIAASCEARASWRQLTTLPLEIRETERGVFAVTVAPERLGEVVGRVATFELVVEDRTEQSAPQRFDVEIRAPRVVTLAHDAGAGQTSDGELLPLELHVRNGCEASVVADLRIVLDGLVYVPGSGRLAGAPRELEPLELAAVMRDGATVRGQRALQVRGVALGGGEALTLQYQVRRSGLQAGSASATAEAVLAANPENLLSEPAAVDAADPWAAGFASVGCTCGEAGGASAWPFAGVLALLLRRRRR